MHRSFIIFFVIAFAWMNANAEEVGKTLDPEATLRYWTPERLRDAKPLSISAVRVVPDTSPVIPHEKPKFADGSPPTIDMEPINQKLFTPKEESKASSFSSFNTGTLNEQFSSSQIVPSASDSLFPYRITGKLFFTIPGSGNFTCSASVVQTRIVLTAGHCVNNGTSTGFFTNFLFVPAYHNGTAPFGSWSTTFVTATSVWTSGGGTLPNASDIGMLEIADQSIGGSVQSIGNVTGFYGFQTVSLSLNHVDAFGYPNNLDSGTLMHHVSAQSGVAISPNNFQIGSDMQTGSDGGPWVQNFGIASSGQPSGSNSGFNRVVGVTSLTATPVATALGQSSSLLDNNFINVFVTICAHKTNNCTAVP